uniref:Uncharacterized protein n=1 Tax=Syphacia muris TaxID=451379 RepID=A0A0N5A943_9BILA
MGSNNRMSINFDAALPSSVYDEETWLVQPPEEANGSSSSGHVVEWLQEATLNIDYETRSALARKLNKQVAKKKKKAEKLSEKYDSKRSDVCDIKESVVETETEIDLFNPAYDSKAGEAVNLNSHIMKTDSDSLHSNDSYLLARNSVSESSSDEEFYDVPEYPCFESEQPAEQKAVEKVKPLSHDLSAVKECAEEGKLNTSQDLLEEVSGSTSSRFVDHPDTNDIASRSNTARVPPTVVLDKTRSPAYSPGANRNPSPVLKSSSVAGADLVYIQQKAILQELALREECNLWKPSSQTDCTTPISRLREFLKVIKCKVFEGTTSYAHPDIMKGSLSLSSSRSADFLDSVHPNTVSSVSTARVSRLPMLVRRPVMGVHSSGPSRYTNSSTLRPHFGDAAAALSRRRTTNAQSECGCAGFQRKS